MTCRKDTRLKESRCQIRLHLGGQQANTRTAMPDKTVLDIGGHAGSDTRYFHYDGEGHLVLEETFDPADPWWGLSMPDRDRGFVIVGRSPPMVHLFKLVSKLSDSRLSVVLNGPSGTGKELIAWALGAKRRPFVAINCAGLSDTLLESELFGHVKGAFTGATSDRKGKFRTADGGTLFLDEIGDMPLHLQAKLLRVLETGEVAPVGSDRPVKVVVRVVSASHKDLTALVEQGAFREDLYYRLQVVTLALPSLQEHTSDIPLLVAYWLLNNRSAGMRQVTLVRRDTLERLGGHHWPGNVRELENAIEGALALGEGPILRPEEFDAILPVGNRTPGLSSWPRTVAQGSSRQRRSEREAEQIRDLLYQNPGATAKQLARMAGLSTRTMQRRLKDLENTLVRSEKDKNDARLIRYLLIAP